MEEQKKLEKNDSSIAHCLFVLVKLQQAGNNNNNSKNIPPATWRDTPATSTAASPSSVNNRVEQKKNRCGN